MSTLNEINLSFFFYFRAIAFPLKIFYTTPLFIHLVVNDMTQVTTAIVLFVISRPLKTPL